MRSLTLLPWNLGKELCPFSTDPQRTMLPAGDDTVLLANSRFRNPSTIICVLLSFEFLIGLMISAFLAILTAIKSFLPKPPRDISGDVVVVAGATSSLGESLAEEFAKGGCSVICVDDDLRSAERIASRLDTRHTRAREEIVTSGRKHRASATSRTLAYGCNLSDREEVRNVARRIDEEIGPIDVLVTCAGTREQSIFDTASTTLMSHYWTVMAFLQSMSRNDRAYIVGVTPVAPTQDAYTASRAAIASLMESLGRELSNRSSHLTFLAVSPTAVHSDDDDDDGNDRYTWQSERQVARDVVEAVRRDQCSLQITWFSRLFYRISCAIYETITVITRWLHTPGCDYSF